MASAETKPMPQWSIPGIDGKGRMILSIQPPGTWFDSKNYEVLVGGCGVGGHKTLAGAIVLVQQRAIERLENQAAEGSRRAEYAEAQLRRIRNEGWDYYIDREPST